jgi:hypothetical protein
MCAISELRCGGLPCLNLANVAVELVAACTRATRNRGRSMEVGLSGPARIWRGGEKTVGGPWIQPITTPTRFQSGQEHRAQAAKPHCYQGGRQRPATGKWHSAGPTSPAPPPQPRSPPASNHRIPPFSNPTLQSRCLAAFTRCRRARNTRFGRRKTIKASGRMVPLQRQVARGGRRCPECSSIQLAQRETFRVRVRTRPFPRPRFARRRL